MTLLEKEKEELKKFSGDMLLEKRKEKLKKREKK